jgi:integrase/recombinase XerD
MGSSQPPGPALAAAAADADPVALMVTAWLSVVRSENTRTAYARDIGITPQQRPSRAPSWLTWCHQQEVHPVAGVTALHVAQYARQLDEAGLSPASAARKLAAISSWYAWLARRGHITASPAAGSARPRPGSHSPPASALTRGQALALMHAADSARGPQRARTAALIAVLLLTGARLSEITGADVADLGTSGGHPVLWVTRASGRRLGLPLPALAASRLDAYLAGRPGLADDQALFATRAGGRLFAADVRQTLHRLATWAGLPAEQARHLGPRAIRQSFTTLYLQAAAPVRSTRHTASRPRGKPHCRARQPQHATGHIRPRLSLIPARWSFSHRKPAVRCSGRTRGRCTARFRLDFPCDLRGYGDVGAPACSRPHPLKEQNGRGREHYSSALRVNRQQEDQSGKRTGHPAATRTRQASRRRPVRPPHRPGRHPAARARSPR